MSELYGLTHELPETHRCILSTVDTDAPMLKHQAINIYSTDEISITVH